MMCFVNSNIIFGMHIHDFSQLLVEVEHNINSNAEIGCHKQTLFALQAIVYHIFQLVVPTGGTYHDRYVAVETFKNIIYYCVGCGKINSNIATA